MPLPLFVSYQVCSQISISMSKSLTTGEVCPRLNLLRICDFMAQLQNITFNKISLLIFLCSLFSVEQLRTS